MDIDQEITNAMPTVANVGEAPHHHRDHHHAGDAGGPEAAIAAAEAAAAREKEEREDAAGMAAMLPKLEGPSMSVSPRQTFILIRWAQKVAGALVGLGTAAFLLLYQWVIEPAPYHSLRTRAFVGLTQVRERGAQAAAAGQALAARCLAALPCCAAGLISCTYTLPHVPLCRHLVNPLIQNTLQPSRQTHTGSSPQGVLRGAMLGFYSSASDFTRRLTSVSANGKFSRVDAGPEEDWEEAVEDLKGVIGHIKQR